MSRVLVMALLLVACNQQRPSQAELLKMAASTYNEGLRWKRYTDCAGLMPPEQRDGFLRRMEDERDDLSFVEYDVRRMDLNADTTAATIEVDYTWFRMPSTTLQTTRMRQRWAVVEDAWVMFEQTKIERKDKGEAPDRLLELSPPDQPPPARPGDGERDREDPPPRQAP